MEILSGIDFVPRAYRPASLAVSGGSVFWGDASETPVSKADFEAHTVTPLAMRMETPERVIVAGDRIYWIELGGRLRSAALDGGSVQKLGEWVDSSFIVPQMITDDTSLYFVAAKSSPSGYSHTIRKMPLDGGPSEELVAPDATIWGLAQDDFFLYWTEALSVPGPADRVRRMSKFGGSPETLFEGPQTPFWGLLRVGEELVFAERLVHGSRIVKLPVTGGVPTVLEENPSDDGRTYLRDLGTDGTDIYWIDSSTLNAVALAGGAPRTLADGLEDAMGLEVGDDEVFWTESPYRSIFRGSLKKVPIAGGVIETLASGLDGPGQPFLSDSNVYWPEPGRIAEIPLDGGEPETLVSGVSGEVAYLAVDGTNVYVADGTYLDGSIKKIPIDGGVVEKLAKTANPYRVFDIAADGTFVYWLYQDGPVSVFKVPVEGGLVETLASSLSNLVRSGSLAVAGGNVTWFESFGETRIEQVPTDGGAVTTLAEGLSELSDLAADDDQLFFSTFDTGAITRLDSGGMTPLAYGFPNAWSQLALNEQGAFWTSQGSVGRVGKDGGPRAFIVRNQPFDYYSPDAVAADDSSLYFTNIVSGWIVRAVPRLDISEFSFASASGRIAEMAKFATVAVKRTGGLSAAASVGYSTFDGTANQGSDYTAVSGTLAFAPGVARRTFSVPILDDRNSEQSETILLRLGPAEGCASVTAPDTEVLTVKDDDPVPLLRFTASKYSTSEAKGSVSITVQRVANLAGSVTVDFATSDGTATAGADYTQTSGVLTFDAGVVSQTFAVPIADDALADAGESFTVSLSNPQPSGVELGLKTSSVTIADNDQGLQFSMPSYLTDEIARRAIIHVKRVGGTSGTVTVDYSVTGGSATNGADFSLSPGTLTFGPGQATKAFAVEINHDAEVEGSETVALTLGNPTGATVIGVNPAILTIRDSEPVFQFMAPEYAVGESGPARTIAVRRSGVLTSPATVDCQITGGTATEGVDYSTQAIGTLTFGAGRAVQRVTIVPIGDRVDEADETVTLQLTQPSAGYGIGTPATTVLTIRDNDVAGTVQFSAENYSIAEDESSVTITVTRTGGASEAAVDYATSDGTARSGTNYLTTEGSLQFGYRETTKTITVPILQDGASAGSTFLSIALGNPGGGLALGVRATATVWIVASP